MSVTSGRRRFKSVAEAKKVAKQARNRGAIKGTKQALNKELPLIAKEFGTMRSIVRSEILEELLSQLDNDRIILAWPKIEKNIVGALERTQYHIRGHAEFNPNFADGYDNPSTFGTEPINPPEIMRTINEAVNKQVEKELLSEGIRLRRGR